LAKSSASPWPDRGAAYILAYAEVAQSPERIRKDLHGNPVVRK